MKRFYCLLILIALALFIPSALAFSIPSVPDGWSVIIICRQPDLPSSDALSERPACDLDCILCGDNEDCPSCPLCGPCFYTAIPPTAPTEKPKSAATVQPTSAPDTACNRTTVPVFRPSGTKQPTATAAVQRSPAPTARADAIPSAKPTASTGNYTTLSSSAQEQKLLNLVNQDRAANGLPALTLDPELSSLARMKACDMNQNNYFAHESPTYGSAADMLTRFGYNYNGVGENIAHHATVEKAEAAFLSSEGHRRNIMGSQWDRVGIGVCTDENGYVYVTELFAR